MAKRSLTISTSAPDIIWFQRLLLTLFGILPPNRPISSKKIAFANLTFAAGITLLVGTCLSSVMQITLVGSLFYFGSGSSATTGLLQALIYIPYSFINLRAFVVCAIAIRHRNAWPRLKNAAYALVLLNFPSPQQRQARFLHWQNLCVTWGFLTVALIVIFETVDWIHYIEQDNRRSDRYYNFPLDPLPFGNMTTWEYELIYSIFNTLPYLVSQQVYVVIGSLAIVLGGCIGCLVQDLNDTRTAVKEFVDSPHFVLTSVREANVVIEGLRNGVANFRERHNNMLIFSRELADIGRFILFIIYAMDVATICGFVAALIAGTENLVSNTVLSIGSIAIFGAYATLFLLPLVIVHEQCESITNAAYQLSISFRPLVEMDTSEARLLNYSLDAFVRTSIHQTMIFDGAGLLHVTRSLLAGTWTFIASSVFIGREILGRGETLMQSVKCSCCPGAGNISGSNSANNTVTSN